ncbi:16S rRNA (cytidine1402-2'-O)-methyltransferase [Deinobacterium chartae]|uniref:Ribosomal RNA small subunit methyltransferase I n=1 Tax=Deinobacterium chartae TaxID=521158 RepID=A0A841I3L4_9DEIO|nr:16S rRNA (cytidine(1402)-2'-O)-methyltransferase [Deinobacterium chartae]MBB6098968.1 16S rRNA (cytidine1402-2'-O)-methyltransferase [Deinobacterium chartae]
MPHVTLVPTPVGNLSDITLRALEVLKNADAVAAEDTRVSGSLLRHYGIDKPLVRLDQHTMRSRAPGVLEQYPRLAFVTDAGTPGISDPGEELVRIVLEAGGTVEVLPGATALIPALVLSGFSTARFHFEGFMPRSGRERRERLAELVDRTVTSVFYESPHRLVDTLEELAALAPGRAVSVTRELSKKFEETYRGSLEEAAAHFAGGVKGEVVVVLSGAAPRDPHAGVDFRGLARAAALEGKSTREIRDLLVQSGLRKNDAYVLALEAIGAAQ